MPAWPFRYFRGGIHLPELALWLDAAEARGADERVFVSHAHSDHTARHRSVILSEPTARLMRARLGGERVEHLLPFGHRQSFGGPGQPFHLTLLPAGHILGSAMSLVEWEGHSLLYTGDFKLRRGRTAEACDPSAARGCESLIMETTFGRPGYIFPPADELWPGVIRFCREALDHDETAVLLGWSLGKSQEILSGLAGAGLPVMLHSSVAKLTRVYEGLGHTFPPYEDFDVARARGKVLICPPSFTGSPELRSVGARRVAALTGWACDPGCRFQYRADAAFPLSDHADFDELIEFVRLVQPRQVFTLHGFAAEFAETLRGLGFAAQALSEDDQLSLGLAIPVSPGRSAGFRPSVSVESTSSSRPPADASPPLQGFTLFAATCAAIAAVPGKLDKTRRLAEYLRTIEADDARRVTAWFGGSAAAAATNRTPPAVGALLRETVCAVAGVSAAAFHHAYLKHSDLGETAAELFAGRSTGHLELADVHQFFDDLRVAPSAAVKREHFLRTLRRCGPVEAKFLLRIVTGDLRLGLNEALIEDALAAAFNAPIETVRRANQLVVDLGEVATLARAGELSRVCLVPFRPVRLMCISPAMTAAAVWERLAATDRELRRDTVKDRTGSIWIEDQYDGLRGQLHKVGPRVALYARERQDVTAAFPEIVEAAGALAADVILDGIVVARRGETLLPSAVLQQRLDGCEADLFSGDEMGIGFVAFDLLWLDGVSWLDRPLAERRAALDALSPLPPALSRTPVTPAASLVEIENALLAARARQIGGVIIKNPRGPYTPMGDAPTWLSLLVAAPRESAG